MWIAKARRRSTLDRTDARVTNRLIVTEAEDTRRKGCVSISEPGNFVRQRRSEEREFRNLYLPMVHRCLPPELDGVRESSWICSWYSRVTREHVQMHTQRP